MGGRRGTPEERFWRHVERGDDCWRWTAHRIRVRGKLWYGMFNALPRTPMGAHRFSWELHNGPIPNGLFVLHSCDNPECTNPKHLFLGTQADNVRDMTLKRRHTDHRKDCCYQGHRHAQHRALLPSGKAVCRECQRIGRNRRSLRKFGRLPFLAEARRTQCPKGHPYSAENTIRPKRGGRQCRECAREGWRRAYRRRQKAGG